MQLIKPSFEVLKVGTSTNPNKLIEKIARVCYKSEDKITFDSDSKMIKNLIHRNHTAMLEHYTFIFEIGVWLAIRLALCMPKHINITFSNRRFVMSANVRALRELAIKYKFMARRVSFMSTTNLDLFDDFKHRKPKYIKQIYEYDLIGRTEKLMHCTVSIKFTCDRGISHEIVRHRKNVAYAQESTRYCNYGGGHMKFIIPGWLKNIPEMTIDSVRTLDENIMPDPNAKQTGIVDVGISWAKTMLNVEKQYNDFITFYRWTPQQARCILPNSLKTEIVVTANLDEWYWIFSLRCAPDAHPQMRESMIPVQHYFRDMINIIT